MSTFYAAATSSDWVPVFGWLLYALVYLLVHICRVYEGSLFFNDLFFYKVDIDIHIFFRTQCRERDPYPLLLTRSFAQLHKWNLKY